ncbi:OmpA family protein [Alcaligenaceae bacterium]|nr:OmpA family protein [Alcaligenaceae bacterium]
MSEHLDEGVEPAAPVWAVFGDLMSVLLGAFVLVLVGVIGVQLELSARLENEITQRQEETQRRKSLEEALARQIAEGSVTLTDGRIGISGSVLFALNSAGLQAEGREILNSLVEPLKTYLETHDEVLMISGFTDDRPIHEGNLRFSDNWDLSAQRALTVTRALIEEGVPSASVFAAAFGPEQPVSSNDDEEGRAKNRRVEISPVPKLTAKAVADQAEEGKPVDANAPADTALPVAASPSAQAETAHGNP